MKATAQLIFLAFGVLLACVAQAAKTLVLQDGDGNRIGELLYEQGGSLPAMVVLTTQNDLVRVDAPSGALSQGNLSRLNYESNDCSGQAFIATPTDGSGLLETGGQVVRAGTSQPAVFARVDWFAEPRNIYLRSIGVPESCQPADIPVFPAIPVTRVDPALYNIQEISFDTWGIKPTMQIFVEQPDTVFCSSFEDCGAP